MSEEVAVKTPVLNDKRLQFAAATIISLLLARYLGVPISADVLTVVIGGIVAVFTASSAAKEASVAKAVIKGRTEAEKVTTVEAAADIMNARVSPPPPMP